MRYGGVVLGSTWIKEESDSAPTKSEEPDSYRAGIQQTRGRTNYPFPSINYGPPELVPWNVPLDLPDN